MHIYKAKKIPSRDGISQQNYENQRQNQCFFRKIQPTAQPTTIKIAAIPL